MADSNVMVYEGQERTFTDNQSPLQIFKGPEARIQELALQDGCLYFATDSKKIYLDCDFTDSLGTKLKDRIAFGGSTGIYYANKTFTEAEIDIAQFIFTQDDFEEVDEVPMVDDLILNEGDGSFYRVTEVEDYSTQYQKEFELAADRLTVSGTGGGGGGTGGGTGGGGAVVKIIGGRTKYWAREATSMPITFKMTLEDPEETIGYRLYIGKNSTTVRVQNSGLPQSTDEQPTTVNLADFKDYIDPNVPTEISIMPFGDDGTEVTRSLKWTVTLFNISIAPYIDNIGARVGEYDNYTVIPTFGTELQNVILNWKITDSRGNEIAFGSRELSAVNSQRQVSLNIGEQTPGTYHIITQLQADIPGSSGQRIYSAELDQVCSWVSSSQDVPVLSVSFPLTSTEYQQYDVIQIPFTVYYRETTIAIKKYVIFTNKQGNTTTTEIDSEIINTGSAADPWVYSFQEAGTYRFRIVVGDNATSDTSGEYTIAGVSSKVPTIQRDGLVLYLNPNKTNSSATRDIWQNEGSATYTKNGEIVPVDVSFTNVNWQSNGWGRDSDGVPMFHLDNGAKLTVNGYSPFAGGGAQRTGRTIELDLKISNIKDRNQRLLTCVSENTDTHTINTGIVGNGDFIALNGSAHSPTHTWESGDGQIDDVSGKRVKQLADNETGLVAWYCEGERVRVTFVITIEGEGVIGTMPKGFVYTYINGVISGLVQQSSGETFADGASVQLASRFIFDSAYADIDIYGIRVYETALDDHSVLTNYLATIGNTTESIELFEENDLLDETTGRVSLAKVIAYGKIPYLVLRGGRECDKNISKFEGYGSDKEVDLPSGQNSDSDGHDNGKKDFRFMEGYLVNPLTGFNIGSAEDRRLLTVYCQGTSSLQYPVKNLRIKFWKKDTAVNKYTPLMSGGKGKKDKVKVYERQPASASVYTLKADYMDSSSAHNTGTGNALPELYGSSHKTLPQMINDKILTAINGYPIVIFWKKYRHTTNIQSEDTETIRSDVDIANNGIRPIDEATDKYSDYEYIGRYNFNLDKSEAELFGFYQDPENHYGIRLDSDNIYQAIANTDVLTGLRAIPVTQGTFRALADMGDDLTYNPEQVYYTKPSRTSATWSQPTTDNNGQPISQKVLDTGLADRLSNGPLYVYDAEGGANSIQCWEFSTNNVANHPKQLQFFQEPWDEEEDSDYGNWTEAFESRYPEYSSEAASDKRSFARLINWVASTNAVKVGHEPTAEQLAAWTEDPSLVPANLKPLHPDPLERRLPTIEVGEYVGEPGYLYPDTTLNNSWNNIPYAEPVKGVQNNTQYTVPTTFYYDSFEWRLHKFKSELNQYMDLDFTLMYYIITEFLIGKDSRAKNMMMVCYDANPENNTGHWFPIFYDVDTILGLDNVGKLRYRYDEEDYNYGIYNTNADYYDLDGVTPAANYSVLWSNIRRTCYNEIKTLYREMRSRTFNYNNLVDIYNTRLSDAWNATLTNQDVWYKFIRFLTGYIPDKGFDDYPVSTASPGIMYQATDGTKADAWIPAVQGTRSLHRKQIMRRRLAYLDGKYSYTDGGVTIGFRAQAGQPGADEGYTPLGIWDLTVHDSCYLSINSSAETTVGPFRFDENTRRIINSGQFSGTEQEMNFHFFNQVSDSHDLSGQRMGTLSLNAKPDMPHRLINLDLTHSRPGYEQTFRGNNVQHLTQLNLGSLPYLEKLNVSYLTSLASVSLANNPYIKEVYAQGMGSIRSSITFPEGGILQHIELPKTINTIDLKGHNQLSILVMEDDDYSNVSKLYIEDCRQINTKNLFTKISSHGTVELLQVRLPDINWTFNYDEVVIDGYRVVTSIPLLDKLILASGDVQSSKDNEGNLIEGRTYVAGTITINNDESGHEFGIDENELYEAYGKYYPGIKFVFVHNSWSTTAYTFNAWTASGGLVQQKKLKQNVVDNITFEQLFNNTLPPQTRETSPKYEYEFVGWNIQGNMIIEEEDDDHNYTLEEAITAANNIMVAKYSSEYDTYTPGEVIEFSSAMFDPETREFNIYPTFLGRVRSFVVTFYNSDDVDTAEVYEEQTVKYGRAATAPAVEPVKVVFNNQDVNDTRIYTLSGYSRSFASITTENVKIYPRFNTTYTDAKTYLAPAEAFDILNNRYTVSIDPSAARFNSEDNIQGLEVAISRDYSNEFITIPTSLSINGQTRQIVALTNYSTNLKRVYFQEGNNVRVIEPGAFCNQQQLEFVDLAACTNLYAIGAMNATTWQVAGAFSLCPNLKVTSLPDSLAIIGPYSFYALAGTNSEVTISALPEHLQLLGMYAFTNCTKLGLLRMSDFLHDIPNYCFMGCTNLRLPDTYYFQGVYTIGMRAFEDCAELSTFRAKSDSGTYQLSGTLTSIGEAAFRNCTSLSMEALPVWTLKEIGRDAFRNCGYIKLSTEMAQPTLTSVESDKVLWGKNAFAGCSLYRRLEDANGNYVGIESLMPRFVLKYASNKYDINREVFGEDAMDGLQFAYYEFGDPIDYHDGQPVYRESDVTVEGGLNLFVSESNWGSFGQQYTENRNDIAWLSNSNTTNPWVQVLNKLFETGQLRIWYTKNGSDYIYHSNLRIYMTNN